MKRIRDVLHMILSTIINIVTLPFRALKRLLAPRH